MKNRGFIADNTFGTFYAENKFAIGQRLRDARGPRTARGVGRYVVGLTMGDIFRIESGSKIPTDEQFMKLCSIYGVQEHDVLHGPYPYQTHAEWFDTFSKAEVSEDELANGLHVDLVKARYMYRQWVAQIGEEEE